MGKFQINKATNKFLSAGQEHSGNPKRLDVLWLLVAQPTKTFSSADIIDVIMESGIMIHEKQFIEMIGNSICRKTGVQLIKKTKGENYQYKNKFMNNDFDYL